MASFIEGRYSIEDAITNRDTHGLSLTDGHKGTAKHPPSQRKPIGEQLTTHPPPLPPVDKNSIDKVFERAANILRESTLAEGAVIFSVTPEHRLQTLSKEFAERAAAQTGHSPASSVEVLTYDTDDSDMSPSAKPCKVVAVSFADKETEAQFVHGAAVSVGTLERYCQSYPHGKTFLLTGTVFATCVFQYDKS
jgi:hypothetical protein